MPTAEVYQGSSTADKKQVGESDEGLDNRLDLTMVTEQALPPWMPTEAGKIMSFGSLHENGVMEVQGYIACTKCNTRILLTFPITEHTKYVVTAFINRSIAAPYRGTEAAWFNPDLPNCQNCEEESSIVPILAEEEESVDWLFLLLAQMVIFCSYNQLCNYCAANGMMAPETKLHAIKEVYRHLLHQFLTN